MTEEARWQWDNAYSSSTWWLTDNTQILKEGDACDYLNAQESRIRELKAALVEGIRLMPEVDWTYNEYGQPSEDVVAWLKQADAVLTQQEQQTS